LQGHAVGQLAFDGGAGVEVEEDAGVESVPLLGVLAGQDGAFGAEAVLDGIEGGALLAGVGARAGGMVGHDVPRDRDVRVTRKPRLSRAPALLGERFATHPPHRPSVLRNRCAEAGKD